MRNVMAARFVKALIIVAGLNLLAVQAWSAPAAGPGATKDWTLLIFLNGKNNLDTWGIDNLIEMERVGSTDRINIVVEWGSLETKETKRLYITRSSDPTQVTSPVLQDLGNVDMGDWRTLSDFVRWGVQSYPARHYFIDVWDHGTGWHDLKGVAQARDISHDETTGHWINTPDLAHAVSDAAQAIGHKVDIFATDACEMGMAEVASELQDTVALYGGSEIEIPVNGWPYEGLLRKWDALPSGGEPLEVARLLTSEFVAAYMPGGVYKKNDASYTFYDLSETSVMTDAISGFASALLKMDAGTRKQAIDAATESTEITSDYDDFLDFADRLQAKQNTSLDRAVFKGLDDAAARYIVAHGHTDGYAAGLKGISIWFPRYKRTYTKYLKAYQGLRFSVATHWENAVPSLFLP